MSNNVLHLSCRQQVLFLHAWNRIVGVALATMIVAKATPTILQKTLTVGSDVERGN